MKRWELASLEDAERAFFGVCVETGKLVLGAVMEQDRIALCGPAGRHDAERQAIRAGHTESAVVLGGRRIGIPRPRVRSMDDRELRLPSFEAAAHEDPLDRATLAAIASGVTMRSDNPGLTAPWGSRSGRTVRRLAALGSEPRRTPRRPSAPPTRTEGEPVFLSPPPSGSM